MRLSGVFFCGIFEDFGVNLVFFQQIVCAHEISQCPVFQPVWWFFSTVLVDFSKKLGFSQRKAQIRVSRFCEFGARCAVKAGPAEYK